MNYPFLIDGNSEAALELLAKELRDPEHRFLAFVGAGVSRQCGLPLWKELMIKMDEEVQEIHPRLPQVREGVRQNSDLLWQAEVFRLELERKNRYSRFLRKTFSKQLPRENTVIHHLVKLPFRHFLTTNYDTFLEQALVDQKLEYDEFDWNNREESRDFFLNYLSPKTHRYVLHIHGRSDQPHNIVLTYRDYVKRYVESLEYVDKLSILLATLRLVFIGFSLEDPDLRFILRQVNSRFATGDVQHYSILGFSKANELQAENERKRLESQFGISSIFYDDADGHAALKEVLALLNGSGWPMPEKFQDIPPITPLSPSINGSVITSNQDQPTKSLKTKPSVSWDDDPHKGYFGGSPTNSNGTRHLSVKCFSPSKGIYPLELKVESIGPDPLKGKVIFHVHPTFPRSKYEVEAHNGEAILKLKAYGAFTVGVECDDKKTRLELDLAEQEELPEKFRKN